MLAISSRFPPPPRRNATARASSSPPNSGISARMCSTIASASSGAMSASCVAAACIATSSADAAALGCAAVTTVMSLARSLAEGFPAAGLGACLRHLGEVHRVVDRRRSARRGVTCECPRRARVTVATREQERSPSDGSDVLRSVALSLKAHASDHAAAIAHGIHGRMPEFGADARVTQQTVDAITAIITGFARMVLRAEAPEDVVVPAEALEYSRTFARRGIDYSLLVRIYRLGHEELRRVCESTVAEQALGPEALGSLRDELSTALFDYDDIVSGRVLEEYDAERARWAPSPDKLRHETVAAILAMEPVEADRASRALRYRLDVIHVAFVLWVVDATEGLGPKDRMHAAARDLVTGTACAASLVVPAGKLVTWGWLGFREQPDEQQMAALLSSGRRTDGVSVAVGEPAPGIDGFRRSHEDASSARRLASLSHTRPGTATRWGNVAALGLLSADPE